MACAYKHTSSLFYITFDHVYFEVKFVSVGITCYGRTTLSFVYVLFAYNNHNTTTLTENCVACMLYIKWVIISLTYLPPYYLYYTLF